MKTLEQHTEEVMDWFDFNKVEKIMKFLDWKWSLEKPEIADMRKSVRNYMKSLHEKYFNYKSVNAHTGSGGFDIRYVKGIEDGEPWDHFDVSFQLTSWYTGE